MNITNAGGSVQHVGLTPQEQRDLEKLNTDRALEKSVARLRREAQIRALAKSLEIR
jgi:hypothetical protein